MASQTKQSDKSGKRLFSHPRVVADLIRLLGGDWVDDLDFDKLERLPVEHVAKDLRSRLADMSWWAPFKPNTGRPRGAGVLFHIELQSSPHPHMMGRLLEYVALLRQDLHGNGWMAAHGGREVVHLPLVVYNGKAKWNAPLRLEAPAWTPPELAAMQPRLAGELVDAKDYAGDDADGNLTRAALALDAAPGEGLGPALAQAAELFWAADGEEDDQELWLSFEAWCDGILGPRLGDGLRTFVEKKEKTMLRETLREWDEQNRQEGLREGLQEGLQGGKRTLCSQARQRFGEAAGAELSGILARVDDGAELERVGTLIIGCDTEADFLARVRSR